MKFDVITYYTTVKNPNITGEYIFMDTPIGCKWSTINDAQLDACRRQDGIVTLYKVTYIKCPDGYAAMHDGEHLVNVEEVMLFNADTGIEVESYNEDYRHDIAREDAGDAIF